MFLRVYGTHWNVKIYITMILIAFLVTFGQVFQRIVKSPKMADLTDGVD